MWLYLNEKESTKIGNMVLAQPDNKHVVQAFSLKGKVAIVTGKSAVEWSISSGGDTDRFGLNYRWYTGYWIGDY